MKTRHDFLTGAAHDGLNLFQLVQLVLAGKDGLAHQQLRKDAAHTPHVNLCIVLLSTQQELGRPALKRQFERCCQQIWKCSLRLAS